MPRLSDQLDTTLRARQNQHSTTQLCLVALTTVLISLVILTHNPEFEKPVFIIIKTALCLSLLVTYAIEGLRMYE